MWIVFALALLIRLAYNLLQPNTELFACDGFEYLTDAQSLLTFMQGKCGFQSLHDLTIAGPVFPLFILGSYLLFGQAPGTDHALPLLITQSVVSALTCVFIAAIVRSCWNQRAGQVAGLIAVIYPAFIINSGRLYTETFATFLLTGLLLLLCKIIQRHDLPLFICLAAGFTAAALQLTRSSMSVLSIASLLIITGFCFQTNGIKATVKTAVAFAAGFALIAIPWMLFSYAAFGTASLLLDRAGHYNFYIGNNVDSWGWLSVPHTDLTGIDRAGWLQLFRCATHKNLAAWCSLLLDKPHRLFDFPWNDFRTSIGPIGFHVQVLFHQALLLLAAVGIGLSLFFRRLIDDVPQFACRLLLLGTLLFHFTYMFFITVPRYNLTAMPLVISFAAAGLVQLITLLADKDTRRQSIIVTGLAAVLFFAYLVVPTRAHGRLGEHTIIIPSGKSLISSIRVPQQTRACYLLIDGAGIRSIQDRAAIRVNGIKITGPFIPGLSLMGNLSGFQAFDKQRIYLECGYIFNCLSSPANISNVDLRQWFFIPLPQDVLESASKQGSLQVEIKPATTTPLLFFAQHIAGKKVLMPSYNSCSWEKAFYGVENDNGFSDPRYDFKISSTAQAGTFIPDVLLLTDKKGKGIAAPIIAQAVIDQISPANLSISSSSIPPYGKNSFWIIRISGHVSCAGAPKKQIMLTTDAFVVSRSLPSQQPLSLHMTSAEWANQGRAYGSIKSTQTFTYNPPWTPRYFSLNANGDTFDIAFPLMPEAMPGTVQSVKLSLNSGKSPLKLSNCKVEIYDLPSNPLNSPLDVLAPESLSL